MYICICICIYVYLNMYMYLYAQCLCPECFRDVYQNYFCVPEWFREAYQFYFCTQSTNIYITMYSGKKIFSDVCFMTYVFVFRKCLFAHSVCVNFGLNAHSVCANFGLNAHSPSYFVTLYNKKRYVHKNQILWYLSVALKDPKRIFDFENF